MVSRELIVDKSCQISGNIDKFTHINDCWRYNYYCVKLKNHESTFVVERSCCSDRLRCLFTLRCLWPMAHFTPTETRRRLVVSLIVPQFLFCDVIFCEIIECFSAVSSGSLLEWLKIIFNACARYIYGILLFQHISEYISLVCHENLLIVGRALAYLSDLLQFGRSTRLRILITPTHRTSAIASSFFVQGAILWNGLPISVRGVKRRFREVFKSYLLRSVHNKNAWLYFYIYKYFWGILTSCLWMTSFLFKILRTVECVMLFSWQWRRSHAVFDALNTFRTLLQSAKRGFAIFGFTTHRKPFS
jgi:hypothetical protein